MNRSLTILLCATGVLTAGLEPQKRGQMEISGTRPAIPEMVGDYVPIYKPQPDVYTRKRHEKLQGGTEVYQLAAQRSFHVSADHLLRLLCSRASGLQA